MENFEYVESPQSDLDDHKSPPIHEGMEDISPLSDGSRAGSAYSGSASSHSKLLGLKRPYFATIERDSPDTYASSEVCEFDCVALLLA